jgi:hypothetical protein
MKWPRFSLATVGFVNLILAVNLAVPLLAFRGHFFREPLTVIPLLLLPMIDTLMIAAYRLRRHENRTDRAFGFVFFGTVATAFVVAKVLIARNFWIGLLLALCERIDEMTMNGVTRVFGATTAQAFRRPRAVAVIFELVVPIVLTSLPPLLVALGASWVSPEAQPPQQDSQS